MGLSIGALRFIVQEHKILPFHGPVLTLGRQGIYVTLEEAISFIETLDVKPKKIPVDQKTTTNIPAWQGTPNEKYISDVVFFKLLGIDQVIALDISTFENADLVLDLNLPVPEKFHDRFDLVIDGGTVEHVFDIRRALMNIAFLLKPGGRIIHISPCNNWINHGFYQFGPTLFFDYYRINAFENLKGYVANHDTNYPELDNWHLTGIKNSKDRILPNDPYRSSMLLFIATKTIASTKDRIPMQSYYL